MTETNAITIQTDTVPAPAPQPMGLMPTSFDEAWRWAKAYSSANMVPQHFKNKPEDCFVVITMAMDLRVHPLTCLQNISMISGKPFMSSAMAIALANKSGRFAGPIRYRTEGEGEALKVTAYAPLHDGDIVDCTVTYAMAVKEGWTRNQKYKTIPEQMLRYRAAKWLINQTCPEVLFGLDISDGQPSSRGLEQTKNTQEPRVQPGGIAALNDSLKKGISYGATEGTTGAQPEPIPDTEGSSGAVET